MDIFSSAFLFSAKWLFLSLIYLVLFIVLIAVRREMGRHMPVKQQTPSAAAGRLKIIQAGSDSRFWPGAVLALQNETAIGADKGNDLILADRFISARHARLHWDGAGWWAEDLGSTNGLQLNGRRLPPHREQPVPFGATLSLGDMVFELVE